MSLYDILGVGEDATPDELRKAHRRQVMKYHPDKGGDREEFDKVQRAYLILRDPKTRQRYDETGEDTVQPDNEFAEVGNVLVGCFDMAMQQCNGRFDLTDLIAMTLAAIRTRRNAALLNRRELEEAKRNFAKVRDRLSFKGGGYGYSHSVS